jgi:histidine ammonia-lyase
VEAVAFLLTGDPLTLPQIAAVALAGVQLELSPDARARMAKSRALIERLLHDNQVVYGVNTGFGKLSDIRIARSQLHQLQLNLVRSHSSGLGNPLAEEETRAIMLLRANVSPGATAAVESSSWKRY